MFGPLDDNSYFKLFADFTPLVPLVTIYWKRAYAYKSLSLLSALLVLSLVFSLIAFFPQANKELFQILSNLFLLIELGFFAMVLHEIVQNKTFSMVIFFLLTIFLTISISYFSMKGFIIPAKPARTVANIFILLISIAAIIQLIFKENLLLINLPGFWIAAGICFFAAMQLMTESIVKVIPGLSAEDVKASLVFVYMSETARQICFTIAALCYRDKVEEF